MKTENPKSDKSYSYPEASKTDDQMNEPRDVEAATGETRVVMFPDYTDMNPYQSELAIGLREHGHDVALSYGSLLPVLRATWRGNTDVVHFHWLQYYVLSDNAVVTAVKTLQFFLELLTYRIVFDGTVVWTVHNKLEHKKRYPTAERWIKRVFLLYFCDRAIVHCARARKDICAEFSLPQQVSNRIDVVPHGHYIDAYENEISCERAREKLGVPEDERVFLFIGSVRPYKQVLELIEAFKTVNADGTRLIIAGKPWNERLAAMVRRSCSDRDNIETQLTVIPESEFQIYFNAADVAVFPFREDTLTSGSVILAMSFGMGLIAPQIGCLPETLPADGAILYNPADENGLVDSLETALDADAASMGFHNYETISEFDWGRIAAETAAVYEAAQRT